MDSSEELAAKLEGYRAYLALLARIQLGRALQCRVDLSGVVQQTIWEAIQRLQQERPRTDSELAKLLRQLLANNLVDEARKAYAGKRDIRREESLANQLHESSAQLNSFLATQETSVGRRMDRQEQLLRLADALETLPEAQREAVEMHYLVGLTLADVAQQMGRSKPSIAGLLQRGLIGLRARLDE